MKSFSCTSLSSSNGLESAHPLGSGRLKYPFLAGILSMPVLLGFLCALQLIHDAIDSKSPLELEMSRSDLDLLFLKRAFLFNSDFDLIAGLRVKLDFLLVVCLLESMM